MQPPTPLQTPPTPLLDDPLKTAVQNLTLLAALLAYAGLALYVVNQTLDAPTGAAPTVPNVQVAALGALAVALGAGYAAILGVPPKPAGTFGIGPTDSGFERFWKWLTAAPTGSRLLGIGALLYLVVGIVIAATYAFNEKETPEVLKTIAVGFGGYVIAYLGAAYQKVAG